MSGADQELQALSQQLEQVESQLEALHTEVQHIRGQQAEIDEAIDAIDSLDSGSTVQVPVGGGAYITATVDNIDEVIVDIGADYAAERSEADAVDLLEAKKDQLDERIEELNEAIAQLESQGEELGQEAEQRLQQLRQQQAQGGQLPGSGTPD